jgi:predicted outer membrane repeat protein
VVTFENGEDTTAVLSGFTITNGTARSGWFLGDGGGIYCSNSSPVLTNVDINGNTAELGGGIFLSDSSPKLVNVTVRGNGTYSQGSWSGGFAPGIGGGIYCDNSSPGLENVTVSGNRAYSSGGGGIYCDNSSPSLENVTVSGNSTSGAGGGMYCENSNPSLLNVTVSGNSAYGGGGIFCDNSSPSLENVTVSGNTAWRGGGINLRHSHPSLSNVTVSGNTAQEGGGGIYCYDSYPSFDPGNRCNIYFNNALTGNDLYAEFDTLSTVRVVVDTFTVMSPTDYHAAPRENFTFDILHAKVEQVSTDLYVSPGGDDTNGGLSPSDPLRTMFVAFTKMLADSLDPHTVHLAEGFWTRRVKAACWNFAKIRGSPLKT